MDTCIIDNYMVEKSFLQTMYQRKILLYFRIFDLFMMNTVWSRVGVKKCRSG